MKKQTKKTAKIAKTNKTVKAATAKPKRVRKPRTEAQKARRRELAAMKKAESAKAAKTDYVIQTKLTDADLNEVLNVLDRCRADYIYGVQRTDSAAKPKVVKAEPCKCAKAGEFMRALVALMKKFKLV